jgi:hypothetical protein
MTFTTDFDPFHTASPLQAASRFDHCFAAYGLNLIKQASPEQGTVTLIARSPASPPAQALAMNLQRFQPLSIEVRIIFAQLGPVSALDFVLQALSTACRRPPEETVRWAQDRRLLDAHECLTLGQTLCWTGDSMRRSEDSRSAIDRFYDDDRNPEIIAGAIASFSALWEVAKPLPKTLFAGAQAQNAAAALEEQPAQHLAPGTKVVRIDDYLRARRH